MAFEPDFANHRVIDSESGAYLECKRLCVTHDEPGYWEFKFHWQGEDIDLLARQMISNTENQGPNEKSDYHWRFFQVGIPPEKKSNSPAIVAIIKAAFEVYGSGKDPRYVKQVKAEFVPAPSRFAAMAKRIEASSREGHAAPHAGSVGAQSSNTGPALPTVLLYGGPLQPDGNGKFFELDQYGLFAWQVARKMAEQSPHVLIIDDTEAMRFVGNPEFVRAVSDSVGDSKVGDAIFGSMGEDGTRNADGIIDDVYRRFVLENADKPARLLTPFVPKDHVFYRTVLPTLISTPGREIEGIDRKTLQDIAHGRTAM